MFAKFSGAQIRTKRLEFLSQLCIFGDGLHHIQSKYQQKSSSLYMMWVLGYRNSDPLG